MSEATRKNEELSNALMAKANRSHMELGSVSKEDQKIWVLSSSATTSEHGDQCPSNKTTDCDQTVRVPRAE